MRDRWRSGNGLQGARPRRRMLSIRLSVSRIMMPSLASVTNLTWDTGHRLSPCLPEEAQGIAVQDSVDVLVGETGFTQHS